MVVIELSGPASSGKTTLMRDLSLILTEKGYKVATISESARSVEDIDLKEVATDEKVAKQFQEQIIKEQFGKVMEAAGDKSNDYVICDRSMFEFGNYAEIYITDEKWVRVYRKTIKRLYNFIGKYDGFFFRSVGFVDDGMRYSANYELEKELFEKRNWYPVIAEMDHTKRLDYIIDALGV